MSSKSSKKEDGHRVSAAAEAGAGSGRSFFGRLRAGFNAVQQEVATAEELTAAAEKQINSLSQQQPLPDNPTALTPLYFEPEMAMLTNIALHYVSGDLMMMMIFDQQKNNQFPLVPTSLTSCCCST